MTNRDDLDLDLSTIPGLGPVRRKALAAAGVADLRGLLALKVAELAEIQGIGMWQARKIREFLRQRGLLVEGDEDGSGAIVVHEPHTPEEAEAVAVAAQALEAQAQREAATEAEVEQLAEAVAQTMRQGPGSTGADPARALLEEECAVLEQVSNPAERAEAAHEDPEAEEGKAEDSRAELAAHRERVPETAAALIEAIREASVSRRLARQLTRFLVIASEFLGDARGLTDEHRTIAREALCSVEALLDRAMERRRFGMEDQENLADRVRKHRKHLERVLNELEAGAE